MQEFEKCPFGIIGLETAIGMTLERLVHPGKITLTRMVELFTTGPARVLEPESRPPARRLARPTSRFFDTERAWTYDVNRRLPRAAIRPSTATHSAAARWQPSSTGKCGVGWAVTWRTLGVPRSHSCDDFGGTAGIGNSGRRAAQ